MKNPTALKIHEAIQAIRGELPHTAHDDIKYCDDHLDAIADDAGLEKCEGCEEWTDGDELECGWCAKCLDEAKAEQDTRDYLNRWINEGGR